MSAVLNSASMVCYGVVNSDIYYEGFSQVRYLILVGKPLENVYSKDQEESGRII